MRPWRVILCSTLFILLGTIFPFCAIFGEVVEDHYAHKNNLLGPCASDFSNCTYNVYQYDMWETLKTEPCLKSLVYDFNRLRSAELIYLLHKVHIYQYPLGAFCKNSKPIALGAIERMFDEHSHIESIEITQKTHEQKVQTNGCVGVLLSYDKKNDSVVIRALAADSPAYQGGARQNDTVIGVDGTMVNTDVDVAVMHLRAGPPGSIVSARLLRNGQEINVSIKRGLCNMSSIEWELCRDVGYLHLLDFNFSATGSNFESAFSNFFAHNARGVVVDLRGNPGGRTSSAAMLAGLFLPNDKSIIYLASSPYQRQIKIPARSTLIGNSWFMHVSLVVLVNHLSASSSEIFTGALKVYRRATVIGENTYGKGVGEIPIYLDNGDKLMLTTFLWYLPNGESISPNGLIPNVYNEVARAEAPHQSFAECSYPEDPVLRYAIDKLSTVR